MNHGRRSAYEQSLDQVDARRRGRGLAVHFACSFFAILLRRRRRHSFALGIGNLGSHQCSHTGPGSLGHASPAQDIGWCKRVSANCQRNQESCRAVHCAKKLEAGFAPKAAIRRTNLAVRGHESNRDGYDRTCARTREREGSDAIRHVTDT